VTKAILSLSLVVSALSLAACSGAPQPPPFKPVADTKLLMQSMIDPTADEIWDSVRTIITKDRVEEIRPHTNQEWETVRNHAVTLAESGNLLMMVPRAKDGGEWMQRARELVDTSERAIRACETKNADELFTVGGDIYQACSNCHQKYMDAIVNANK
jgi:hypothetical protein